MRLSLGSLGIAPPYPAPAGLMWICGSNGCQLAPLGTQVYDSAGNAVAAGIADPFSAGTAVAYAITPAAARNQYYDGPDPLSNLATPIGTPKGYTQIAIPAIAPITPAAPTAKQITAAASSPPVNVTTPIPITPAGTPPTSSTLSGTTGGFSDLLLVGLGIAALIFVPRLIK